MSQSPLDGKRRDYRERKIAQRQTPQSEPIMADLPDAGAKLVDAYEAVDRGVGGENSTERKGRVGNRFTRPSEAGHEKLRQAGCQEENRRVLGPREPRSNSLPHEARCQQEDG